MNRFLWLLLVLCAACGPIEGSMFGHVGSGLDTDRPIVLSGAGQSLLNGGQGYGPLSISQLYGNQRYVLGVGLVPLIENCDGEGNCPAAPAVQTESPMSTMANQFSFMTGRSVIVINNSVSGKCYDDLKRGTASYNARLTSIANIQTLLGQEVFVPYVIVAHGNCDTNANNELVYASFMAEWQSNLDEDIRNITNQSTPVELIITQMNSPTAYGKEDMLIADAQLKAANDSGGLIKLALAQSYWLTYSDLQHLTAESYYRLGTQIGEFIGRLWLGQNPRAIKPVSMVIDGYDIRITFEGVRSALAIDTSGWINLTGLQNYGIHIYNAPGISVTSIVPTGVDELTITGDGLWPNVTRASYSFECPDDLPCAGLAGGRLTGIRGALYDDFEFDTFDSSTDHAYVVVFGPGEIDPTGGVATMLFDNDYWLKVNSTDGSDDYFVRADGPDTDSATTQFTTCVNFKLSSVQSPGEGLIAKSARGAFSWALYAGYGTTTGRRLFLTMSANATQAGQAPINWVATEQLVVQLNVEQQACVVFNGSATPKAAFYVDGVFKPINATGGTLPSSVFQTSGGMTLARFRSGTGINYMIPTGYVDRPVFWPTALTATEIAMYYNSGVARIPLGIAAIDPTVWLPVGEMHEWMGRETGTQDLWSGTKFIDDDGVRNAAPGYGNNYWTKMGNPVYERRP